MSDLFSNPRSFFILCAVGLLLIVVNAPLLLAIFSKPGTRAVSDESHWGKALQGGFARRKQHLSQIDELHQRLSQLPTPREPDDQQTY